MSACAEAVQSDEPRDPSDPSDPPQSVKIMVTEVVGRGQHSTVYAFPDNVHDSFHFTDAFTTKVPSRDHTRRVIKCVHDAAAYDAEVRAARQLAQFDPHQQYIRYAIHATSHPGGAGILELLYSGEQTLEATLHASSDSNIPISLEAACSWLCDIGEGLLKLDEAWIRHGDLHLRNIMVDGNRAYIIDFSKASLGSGEYSRNFARIGAHILARVDKNDHVLSQKVHHLLDLLEPRMDISTFLRAVEDIPVQTIRQEQGVDQRHTSH